MKKYIHIQKKDREFIAKALGITERMVFKGIRFESESELAQKVRKLAMSRGGIVMVEIPEIETLHDADGYIRQYLPNDTLLEISKVEGSCDVWHNGEKVRRYENVMVGEIPSIQDWASTLR